MNTISCLSHEKGWVLKEQHLLVYSFYDVLQLFLNRQFDLTLCFIFLEALPSSHCVIFFFFIPLGWFSTTPTTVGVSIGKTITYLIINFYKNLLNFDVWRVSCVLDRIFIWQWYQTEISFKILAAKRVSNLTALVRNERYLIACLKNAEISFFFMLVANLKRLCLPSFSSSATTRTLTAKRVNAKKVRSFIFKRTNLGEIYSSKWNISS